VEEGPLIPDINYSWSLSSHPGEVDLLPQPMNLDTELQSMSDAVPVMRVLVIDDDDSTLDWQGVGEYSGSTGRESSTGRSTRGRMANNGNYFHSEHSDIKKLDGGSHSVTSAAPRVSAGPKQKYSGSIPVSLDSEHSDASESLVVSSVGAEESLRGSSYLREDHDYVDIAEPFDENRWHTETSRSHTVPMSGIREEENEKEDEDSETAEFRDDMPSMAEDARNRGGSLQSTPFSSSSYTSSSHSSSFSYSFNGSTSANSKMLDNLLSDVAGDDASIRPQKTGNSKPRRPLPSDSQSASEQIADEDTTIATTLNSRAQGKKSGIQRSLEKVSRRNWSQRNLRRFITKKSSTRPKVVNMIPESPGASSIEDRPFDERKDRTPEASSQFSPDNASTIANSEMEGTTSTDQAQITAVESKE
jgi:hypothetical protein